MQELLQQLDLDYYRSAQLLIVRAELEQLRQGRPALADVERRSNAPLVTSRSVDMAGSDLHAAMTENTS